LTNELPPLVLTRLDSRHRGAEIHIYFYNIWHASQHYDGVAAFLSI